MRVQSLFACSSAACALDFGVPIYICVVDKWNKCQTMLMLIIICVCVWYWPWLWVKQDTIDDSKMHIWHFGFIWLVCLCLCVSYSCVLSSRFCLIHTANQPVKQLNWLPLKRRRRRRRRRKRRSISRCLQDQSVLRPKSRKQKTKTIIITSKAIIIVIIIIYTCNWTLHIWMWYMQCGMFTSNK